LSGKKGRSGRKKSISTLMAEAIDGVDQRLPEIFQILIDKALAGDKECAIYLVDRVLGRPRLSIDANTKIEVGLDPSRLLQALREREAIESEWLLTPESVASNTQLAPVDSQSSSGTADMADHPDGKWDAAQEGLSPKV
jgi:hypothetical protein